MVPTLFSPLSGILDMSHMTFCVVPTAQIAPEVGSMIWGVTTMSSLRLMAPAGNAVVEEMRVRAERRAAKSCIVNVAEKDEGNNPDMVWWKGIRTKRSGMG
jgi:hypothetical protein